MTGGTQTQSGWSDWEALPLRLGDAVLTETLDGGQAFRWARRPGGIWQGVWSGVAARLRLDGAGRLHASLSAPPAPGAAAALRRYLALDTDFEALADTLPRRTDKHLAASIGCFPGLRILRQPFGETLFSFLCSATKQILQIKQMVALVAERHGPRLSGDPAAGSGLPGWEAIAALSEADLRLCLLGFRARHVHGVARFLAARPGWLEETESLPYPAAKERLLLLPGVGEKIADCVLLFGAGRLEAFPVDVWILRAMADRYGLVGWKPAQVAHFGRVHFGQLAGLAQQYLFAYERSQRPNRRPAGNPTPGS